MRAFPFYPTIGSYQAVKKPKNLQKIYLQTTLSSHPSAGQDVQKGPSSKAAGALASGAYEGIREHDKGLRTQLAEFFNTLLDKSGFGPTRTVPTQSRGILSGKMTHRNLIQMANLEGLNLDAAENRPVGLHQTDAGMREIRFKQFLPLLA